MRNPRYCLTHYPGISSNITNATHFSMPPSSPTLAHRPLQPHWCTTHVTHAGTQPTLACQPRQHATNANTSPILADLLRKHATYDTDVSTKSMSFLKHLDIQLALKIQEKIQQFLLLVLYNSLYFLGLTKHFHKSLEN